MGAAGALVLGLVLGLAVGALAVLGLVRSVGRLTGATEPRAVLRVLLDGLVARPRRDGVAVQRALARRLKHTGSHTASGATLAAGALDVHVSPEDHELLEQSMGIPAAEADLAVFYADHARQQKWTGGSATRVTIRRDISLRPRQAFARPSLTPAPVPSPEPAAAPSFPWPAGGSHDTAVTDVLPPFAREAVTEAYPVGDLTVVHGTDVRTVPQSATRFTIGRGAHNDLVIDSPGIGRDHVVVDHRDDGWWIVPGADVRLDGRKLDAPERLVGSVELALGRGARLRLTA